MTMGPLPPTDLDLTIARLDEDPVGTMPDTAAELLADGTWLWRIPPGTVAILRDWQGRERPVTLLRPAGNDPRFAEHFSGRELLVFEGDGILGLAHWSLFRRPELPL